MKFILLQILFVPIMMLGLSGCYTQLIMPDNSYQSYQDQDQDQEDNSEINNDIYYPITDYGDYYYYYNYPWWLKSNKPAKNENRDNTAETVGNTNGDVSGLPGRTEPVRTEPLIDILDGPPPTVGDRTPVTAGSSYNNSTNNNRDSKVENNVSKPSSSGGSKDRSSEKSTIRNNDGNRNSDGRKK